MAPRGTFDIVGQQCIGTVENDSRKREQFEVVLKRAGRTIASQVVESLARETSARFSINFSGTATGADFAREHVQVCAIDAFGAIGHLKVDSATQIRLIQTYMGKPQEVLLELSFAAGGDALAKLGIGWSSPESTFCWTEGEWSEVTLDFPPSRGNHELTLFCNPFLNDPMVPSQRASVFLNDEPIAFFFKNSNTLFVESIRVPETLIERGGPKQLRLFHPDCRKPKDVSSNSSDGRLLAFAYKKVILARLLEE
jgi:hypothetical protein